MSKYDSRNAGRYKKMEQDIENQLKKCDEIEKNKRLEANKYTKPKDDFTKNYDELTEEEKKKILKEIKKNPKNDFLDLIFYLKRSLNKTDEEIFDMYMKRIKELNLNEEQKNTLLKIIKNPLDYMFDDFDLEF